MDHSHAVLTCCLVPNSSWQIGQGWEESRLSLEEYLAVSHSLVESWGRGPGTRPNFSANDRGWGVGSNKRSFSSSLSRKTESVFVFLFFPTDFQLDVC